MPLQKSMFLCLAANVTFNTVMTDVTW